MIPVSFKSSTAYLLDDAPAWTSSLSMVVELPSHREEGLTGRETRRPLGDTPRLSLSYGAVVQGTALTALRNALRDITTESVLCPLWVAGFEAGATPLVTAKFYVLMGDGHTPEIKDSANSPPPYARPAYPLLVGRLDETPEPSLLTDEVALVPLKFTENADWAISLPAYATPSGLATPGGVRPVWPFRPNWERNPKSGGAEVQIERREIGQGRATADAFFDQPSRRSLELDFTLTHQETWQLLRLWLDMCGEGGNVWVPACLADARLTADVAANDTQLSVDNLAGRGADATTYHILDDLSQRTPVKVTGTSGLDKWTLAAPVGTAYQKNQTRLESLVLARLAFPRLTLAWASPDHARLSLAFREVPWEIESVAGETLGTTMGALPTSAYLYEFSISYPDGTQTWRYTDFERDLDNGPERYTHIAIEHTDITEEANLDRQATQIKSRYFPGHPLALLIPFQLEWPLKLRIFEADISGSVVAARHAQFSGEVTEAGNDGPFLKAQAASLGGVYDRKIPRHLVQPACNWTVFDSRCRGSSPAMDRSAWKWTGTVYAFDPAAGLLSVSEVTRASGPAIALSAHFFAGGYLAIGTGNSSQYRRIADSTAQSGGGVTRTLGAHFSMTPDLPLAVSFYPGCNGRMETCKERFGNFARFGGFPFMPPGNPSAAKVSKNVTAGGKK